MRPLCGAQRHGPICLRQFRIHFFHGTQVGRDSGTVATGDRTRQRTLPALQRVLQRGPRQRREDAFGDSGGVARDQFLAEQLLAGQRVAQGFDSVEDDLTMHGLVLIDRHNKELESQ